MGTVRDKEGLTYNIGAGSGGRQSSPGATGKFPRASLLRCSTKASHRPGVNSTNGGPDGITDSELADRKQGLVGGYFVGLSTTGGVASSILTIDSAGL